MKNILINGLLLTKKYGGVQYSIENLIEAVAQIPASDFTFTVLVSKDYQGRLLENSNLKIEKVSFNSSNRLKRIFFENFSLPFYFKKRKFNLYHSPGYTLPFYSNLPSIVTIHDLIALDFPRLCKNETALYFSLAIPGTIYNSKKIIAVSHKIKSDIMEKFPLIDEQKIEVIHHGVHPRFKRITEVNTLLTIVKKYELPNKFFLFVGNLEPKKNLLRIITAFLSLKKEYQIDQKLVIVGQKGWKYSSIFEMVETSNYASEILFLNYADEIDLPSLYSLAELFLFPSIYEGFGLPIVEAMACGCPVITSDQGSLPEISDGACMQVNPYNTSEIALGILRIINDNEYKQSLIQKGSIRSEFFKWEKAAKRTIEVYRNML